MRAGLIAAAAFVALFGAATAALAQPPPAAPTAPRAPIYEMETLTTAVLPPGVLKQIEPLKTLPAIEALLKENYIPFGWAHRQVSASAMAPALVAKLDSLPPHEVFAVKQGDGALIAVILSKH